MGVTVRRRQGSWWVFIRHRGHRRAKKIGDRATAHLVAKQIRQRLAEGDLGLVPASSAPKLRDYAKNWLASGQAAWKATTHRFYKFNLDLHILPVLGDQPVPALKRSHCRTLITTCRAKDLKPASMRGVNRTLSAVLSQAVDDELLPANPAFRMGRYLRAGDDLPAAVRSLTREEVSILLATAEESYPDYYPFFLCALRTGLRLGELLGLRWADVDLRGRFIEVRRSRVSGRETSPKSKKRRRVDMSRQLQRTLRRLKATRGQAALKAGRPMTPEVFLSPEGHPLDGDNVRSRVFYPLLEAAKLRHVRFHDLRHTFASLLIQQGESLAYVRDQLGHSSIQITADVYGHLIPGANRAAVDKLDEQPSGNPGATKGSEGRS